MLFDPRFVFLSIWLLQVLGHLCLPDFFYPIYFKTWIIVGYSVLSFLIGAQTVSFAQLVVKSKNKDLVVKKQKYYERWIRVISPYVLIVLSAVSVFTFLTMISRLGFISIDYGSLSALRNALVSDFVGERTTIWLLKVFFLGVAVTLYLLCFSLNFSKFHRSCVLLCGLVFAIMTTGRLSLLVFFLASSYILYSLKIIKFKGLLISFLVFFGLFIGIALILKKGDGALWNMLVYSIGSLSSFNHYVVYEDPEILGGALLPNSIRGVLSLFSGEVVLKPAVNPFVFTPMPSNTFTSLFPVYHDFGMLGVTVIFYILGVFHQILFFLAKNSGEAWRYIYALSLYPLVMNIFEEAYISSLGFWLTFLIVPFFFISLYYIMALIRSVFALLLAD